MTSHPATNQHRGALVAMLWSIRLGVAGGIAAVVLDLGGTRAAAATWMATQIASAAGGAG